MMRKRVYSKEFTKQISKLKSNQLINLLKKINEILICDDLNHYKNWHNSQFWRLRLTLKPKILKLGAFS